MPDGTTPDFVIGRSHGLHLRSVRADLREADFIASTDSIDSYDEVVDQASWKLDRFKSNPVILYGHQSCELPIGQATRCEVVNNKLECTVRFASAEANPEAERVWKLVQEKVLRAVSVGFYPSDAKYELRDGKEIFVWYGCELREISVVAIPANPEALAKVAKMKAAATRGSPPSTNERSTEGVNEKDHPMTEKELREALEKANRENLEIRAAKDAAEKASLEKAAAAEKQLREQEVTIKSLQDEKTKLTSEKATLTEELGEVSKARDTATKSLDAANDQLIDAEVDQLVGKKISAAEKPNFVQLRKNSPDLFTSMISNRPDMKLTENATGTDQVAGEKGAPAGADPASDFWTKD